MNPYRILFDNYKKGILDDALTGELHKLLIHAYFTSYSNLNEDEAGYTEDLIIELYAKNELEEEYLKKFRNKLTEDKVLYRKFNLLTELNIATESHNKKRQQNILESDSDTQKEKDQLAKVLREVIEKVHTEKESASIKQKVKHLLSNLNQLFNSIIPSIDFNLPQVKLALVAVSMVAIAIVIWISVDPGPKENLADKIEKTEKLFAANFEPSPHFNYSNTRSIYTSATEETIIDAAIAYNTKNYDTCINFLKEILDKNTLENNDTLSMINFYLGNSYLSMAIDREKDEFLDLSLSSFNKINPNTPYYIPSRWYSALVYYKLGNNDESVRLFDTLIQINYYKTEKAKILKNAILEME